MGRQRLVKSRVENGCLRGMRQQRLACVIALQVVRIVQWSEVAQSFDLFDDIVVDQRRCLETLAAVYDAMTDAFYFLKVADHLDLAAKKSERGFDRVFVLKDLPRFLDPVRSGNFKSGLRIG